MTGASAKVAQAAGIWHTKPTPPSPPTPGTLRRRELASLLVLRAEAVGVSGPGLTVFGDATLRCNAMQKVQGADRAEHGEPAVRSFQWKAFPPLPTPCPRQHPAARLPDSACLSPIFPLGLGNRVPRALVSPIFMLSLSFRVFRCSAFLCAPRPLCRHIPSRRQPALRRGPETASESACAKPPNSGLTLCGGDMPDIYGHARRGMPGLDARSLRSTRPPSSMLITAHFLCA